MRKVAHDGAWSFGRDLRLVRQARFVQQASGLRSPRLSHRSAKIPIRLSGPDLLNFCLTLAHFQQNKIGWAVFRMTPRVLPA